MHSLWSRCSFLLTWLDGVEHQADIAIVGAGFGGAIMAMVARRLGHSVILIERGSHPRFAIGESSTPLANLLMQQLAEEYDLPQLLPFRRWGEWQREHPEIGCGLKRGFSFFYHTLGQAFSDDEQRRNQLLVAASPRDDVADTHWFRADFDEHLGCEAQRLGVAYFDQTELTSFEEEASGVTLRGRRNGELVLFRAGFVVDASGQRSWLHSALGLGDGKLPLMPATSGLFAHFRNVGAWPSATGSPYPVEEAAVHHVFDGGWVWVLKFNNGITSAGVAATRQRADELGLAEGEAGWQRLLAKLPSLAKQFTGAEPVGGFVFSPELSFCSEQITGARWAMLPSAAGFVDPLLSNGFTLTLLGIQRLARLLGSEPTAAALADYELQTIAELEQVSQLIGALYASMDDFELFTAITQINFAAVSYSETVHRLDKPELANSFLLCDHLEFGPASREIFESAVRLSCRDELLPRIREIIKPFNVAGLADSAKRNWYPVAVDDLFASAAKLGSSEDEIREMLLREQLL
ncbi:MAG: FAD-dependent oxidoreductase [Verrucomicrobiota bacterium]|nr:FAD-dependent oxidoreductase [Verrucomicrobiota bacterium]